jgi:hypothetical protein
MSTEVKLLTGGGSILWNQNLLTKTVAKLFSNKIGPFFVLGLKWHSLR